MVKPLCRADLDAQGILEQMNNDAKGQHDDSIENRQENSCLKRPDRSSDLFPPFPCTFQHMLEERVDERPDRRALRQNDQCTEQKERN